MSKYIDADKLKAEIESRMDDCKLPDGIFPTTTNIVRYEELSCLFNFVTYLQQEQPEVDLENELRNYNVPFNDCGWERLTHNTLKEIARHFYELGVNARKEE